MRARLAKEFNCQGFLDEFAIRWRCNSAHRETARTQYTQHMHDLPAMPDDEHGVQAMCF